MKQLRILFQLFFLMTVFNAAFSQEVKQEESSKEASVRKMIESKDYVFIAQFVLPTRGPMRQLTSEYDLKVSKEEIEAYLPFFGRAYSAPMNASEGGIKFTSDEYDYKIKARKKGGWDISIKPEDVRDVRKLFLSVFANGDASLRVLSTNRETIAFNGYIKDKSN